jgi:hypothetical protein
MKWILFAAAGMTTIFLKRKKKSRSDPSLFRKLFGAILQTGIKAVFSELF